MVFLIIIFSLIINIMSSIIYDVGKRFYIKKILNAKSPYHYKKIVQALNAIGYAIKIRVIILLYVALQAMGIVKPVTKKQEDEMLVLAGIALMLILIAIYTTNESKKLKHRSIVLR